MTPLQRFYHNCHHLMSILAVFRMLLLWMTTIAMTMTTENNRHYFLRPPPVLMFLSFCEMASKLDDGTGFCVLQVEGGALFGGTFSSFVCSFMVMMHLFDAIVT
mmetsp:Transcript_50645/g.61065  ORF Transcript_50645/g.61065 Transcript_50645/m.61065 type:complete len:104 (-) Transcript_50645:85-396(-)